MEMENLFGRTVKCTKDNGFMIRCQEAVRQVRGMKRPVPCYDLLAAAFNTIEAVKRAGKKNEILRWYDEEKHRSMI